MLFSAVSTDLRYMAIASVESWQNCIKVCWVRRKSTYTDCAVFCEITSACFMISWPGGIDMPLETARHPGRKCTGHERSRGWYLVSVQLVTPTSFYLFSGKLEYLNNSIVRMKMNPCEEIRRRQMPQTFQEEMKWFAFISLKQGAKYLQQLSMHFKSSMIWDKPFGDLLPTYGR